MPGPPEVSRHLRVAGIPFEDFAGVLLSRGHQDEALGSQFARRLRHRRRDGTDKNSISLCIAAHHELVRADINKATLAVERRQSGRPISQFDAQIAGIALSRGAAVATRNVADFEGIGLTIIDPWTYGG